MTDARPSSRVSCFVNGIALSDKVAAADRRKVEVEIAELKKAMSGYNNQQIRTLISESFAKGQIRPKALNANFAKGAASLGRRITQMTSYGMITPIG